MSDHAARGHATWSASATARNWACSGALTLIDEVGRDDRESEASAWGTACHQLAEKCLRMDLEPASFLGQSEKTKQHTIEVDEEMAETAEAYVDYVRFRSADRPLWIEQAFSLQELSPPFDAGGTADAVIWHPHYAELEVVDLKGGRGVVVEAKGNPQLRTYALGAVLAHPELKAEAVRVTIVQPRAPHKDGRIRSEVFHIADLIEWTTDLLAQMKAAKKAEDDRETMPSAAWAAAYLAAGDHCKFCPAAARCPALGQKALDAAGVWFDSVDQPHLTNQPDQLAPEELAKRLDLLDMIEDWIGAVRGYAHAQAEAGLQIPGYQLVEKQGRRKWAADDQKVASDLVNVIGLPAEDIYARKLKSPAQVEKLLGKKREKEISSMWHNPATGTNLVSIAKTTRPAATAPVDKFFQTIEG